MSIIRAELKPLFAQVAAADIRPAGVPNPEVTLSSGYAYRQMPVHVWAARASLDTDTAALAWCLASESSDVVTYPQYAWAIGEAICNAAMNPYRVARQVCYDKRFPDVLVFGKQGGRWASTWQRPNGRHVTLAKLLMTRFRAGARNLIAAGARQWTDNDVQHKIHVAALAAIEAAKEAGDQDALEAAVKKARNNPPPEVVMRRRYDSGALWVGRLEWDDGTLAIDPWKLSLLGPRGASEAEALAMLAAGRLQWNRPA